MEPIRPLIDIRPTHHFYSHMQTCLPAGVDRGDMDCVHNMSCCPFILLIVRIFIFWGLLLFLNINPSEPVGLLLNTGELQKGRSIFRHLRY